MNSNAKIRMSYAVTIIVLLVAALIIRKNDNPKRFNKKAEVKKELLTPAKDAFSTNYDLYYLKHSYLIKAHRLNDKREYDSAIWYYKKASVKFEREHQWENYVWVNSYIGRLYLYVAGMNYEDALPYLQKAFEKGKQKLSSNHPYMASTYYYLGLYYYYKKLADKSLEMHNKALEILFKNYRQDNIYAADVYEALGNVYANLRFDNTEAKKSYLKSIKINESIYGKEQKSNLTAGYYNLVGLNFQMGDFEDAESFCYEAIKNVPYVKNHRFYWLELLQGVLANIYSEQNLFKTAISKLKSVIRINKENNGDKSYLSYYHTLLGDIYSKTTNYKTAIFYYKKALKLALINDNALFYNQVQQTAATDYSLGMTFLRLKNFDAARFYLNQCLEKRLIIYGKKHRETAIAFQGIGYVYQNEGLPDSALKYFQEGLLACTKNFNYPTVYTVPLSSAINNSFHSFQIIRDKASVLKQLYYSDTSDSKLLYSSFAYYCLADTLMTSFKSKYEREKAKLIFTRDNINIYEEAIDCATLLYEKTKESRYYDFVFNFIDKRKSGLLIEALNKKELLEQAGVPFEEQKVFLSLQQELTFLQNQIDKENETEKSEESVLQILHARVIITEAKIKVLDENISKKYPYYASIQHISDTVALKNLQVFSFEKNSLILEYFWGDKAVYILGIYKDRRELIKVNRTNFLEKYFDTLQANLVRGYVFNTNEIDFISFQRSSFYIYNSLLQPTLTSLSSEIIKTGNKPNLIIIPDGPLYHIPVEALVTTLAVEKEVDYRKLNYLINDYVISYNYSARFLLRTYDQSDNGQNAEVLGFSYSEDRVLKSGLGELNILTNQKSAELPASARELKAISVYMKGKFYMGDDATEYRFKKEAPYYNILHLAVHGEADSQNSYNSRLIFKKNNDSVNDGNLYSYEIYNIPIKAKLAVLSACESGIGKLNPGEGMFSMARGFVYAGCPSLIVSFWKVSDNCTQFIMSDVYKHLSTGQSIDQSTSEAKLEYISRADRRTAHPSNWAAFVAMGNMKPLVRGNHKLETMLFIILVIFLGITGFLNSGIMNFKKHYI